MRRYSQTSTFVNILLLAKFGLAELLPLGYFQSILDNSSLSVI